MPAYYWIQLYKDPDELDVRSIVEYTIDGLISAGCAYQFARESTVEDDSLPEMKQVLLQKDQFIGIDESIQYAVRDTELWLTTERGKKQFPGIRLIFAYDFQFDPDISTELRDDKITEVNQVLLDFWVNKDNILKKDIITISLHTWEEYVLMYGKSETHEYNKQQILKIVKLVCARVCPHFGWLDGECESCDDSYPLLEKGKLPIANEYVVVGPQLTRLLPTGNIEQSPHFVERLENGVLMLHGRI